MYSMHTYQRYASHQTYLPRSVGVLQRKTRVRDAHEPAFQRPQRFRLLFTSSINKIQIQVGGCVVCGTPHAVRIHLRIRPLISEAHGGGESKLIRLPGHESKSSPSVLSVSAAPPPYARYHAAVDLNLCSSSWRCAPNAFCEVAGSHF